MALLLHRGRAPGGSGVGAARSLRVVALGLAGATLARRVRGFLPLRAGADLSRGKIMSPLL